MGSDQCRLVLAYLPGGRCCGERENRRAGRGAGGSRRRQGQATLCVVACASLDSARPHLLWARQVVLVRERPLAAPSATATNPGANPAPSSNRNCLNRSLHRR